VAVSREGLKLSLLPNCGDSFTFYENMIQRCYFTNGVTLMPGSTVVDIGANFGAFAVLAGSIVGLQGRVIAFEPIAKTFARLQKNIELNGLNNVDCHQAAIDSGEGPITFQVYDKSAYATAHHIHFKECGLHDTIETASCLTLDKAFEYLKIDRINLLKVDCEGSEYGIFDTLSPGVAAKIDQIALEVHHVPGTSPDHLAERLETLGFSVIYGPIWVAFNRASQERRT
jgi:FkbM family methyltransferase